MKRLRCLGVVLALLCISCQSQRTVFDAKEMTAYLRTASTEQIGDTMVHVFPNQLTLIHRRNESNQIIAMSCMASPGASIDPDEKLGRMHLMTRLFSKGTESRTSKEIAELLDGNGMRFGAKDNYDYISAGLQCVKGDGREGFDLFADIILNPSFPLEEIRTERQRVLSAIKVREDRSPSATIRRFRERLLAPGPYGRPLEGTPETVDSITQRDLVEAHQAIYRPENIVISIVGDIDFETARNLVEARFGHLEVFSRTQASTSKSYAPTGERDSFTRDVEQGFIATGATTCGAAHEDEPAVSVATAVLGQGMSARFFRELRDKQGLAYQVGATNVSYKDGGFFLGYIGTTPDAVCKSLERAGDSAKEKLEQVGLMPLEWASASMWREVELLREDPVEPDELDRARSYLVGGFLRGLEANSQQAQFLAWSHMMGLGVDYIDRYPDLIRNVNSRDVMRVANKYFLDPTTVILRPEGKDVVCTTVEPEQATVPASEEN